MKNIIKDNKKNNLGFGTDLFAILGGIGLFIVSSFISIIIIFDYEEIGYVSLLNNLTLLKCLIIPIS